MQATAGGKKDQRRAIMLSKYKYGCQYECGKSDRNTNNKYNSMQATAKGPRKSSNTNTQKLTMIYD